MHAYVHACMHTCVSSVCWDVDACLCSCLTRVRIGMYTIRVCVIHACLHRHTCLRLHKNREVVRAYDD